MCGFAALTATAPAFAATRTFSGVGLTANGQGYILVSTHGEFYAFGNALPQVNPTGFTGDIVDVAVTADGRGAMAVSERGQFYAFGSVRPQSNPSGFAGKVVGVAVTADGQGAMAVSSAGQFYAYGTARSQPNPVGFSGGIVDLALTADGQGAMAVSGAGQFYAYGTARSQPNPSGFSGGVVAMDITADGQGAVAVSGTGQLYAYGTARSQVNPTGFTSGIASVDLTADGQGLAVMSGSGQVYAYGSARHFGNGDPGSPDAPSTTANLAQQVLANPNISFNGRLVREDMVQASQGKRSTANAFLAPRMLNVMLSLARTQKIVVTAVESGGSGHDPTSNHYDGRAADLAPGVGNSYAAIARTIYDNRSGWAIDELIFDPMPGGTQTLKTGTGFSYPPKVLLAHRNHVHYSIR